MFLPTLIQSLDNLTYLFDPPGYESPNIPSDCKQIDSAVVLPPLPPGIPFLEHKQTQKQETKNNLVITGFGFIRNMLQAEVETLQYFKSLDTHLIPPFVVQHQWSCDQEPKTLTKLFEDSFQQPLFFYLKSQNADNDSYILDLSFPPELTQDCYREGCAMLGTKLHLTRRGINKSSSSSSDLNTLILNPREARDRYLLNLAMCSASTLMIMKIHFLYCHLLCGMTIYNLAQLHLKEGHPLFEMMIPHGYRINPVNIEKGTTLIKESFGIDFSFTPQGLQRLFSLWMKEYDIENLHFSRLIRQFHLSPNDKQNLHGFSPHLHQALLVHNAVEQYVLKWLTKVYPDENCLQQDPNLLAFYQALQELSFKSTFGPLSKDNLHNLLTTWMYVNIYLHFEHGDEGQEIINQVSLKIPTPEVLFNPTQKHEFIRDAELGRMVFGIVYSGVKKETYPLERKEWISDLQDRIQKQNDVSTDIRYKSLKANHVQEWASQLVVDLEKTISTPFIPKPPPLLHWELGINK